MVPISEPGGPDKIWVVWASVVSLRSPHTTSWVYSPPLTYLSLADDAAIDQIIDASVRGLMSYVQ